MKKKKAILNLIFLLSSIYLLGQDIHFSQAYLSPLSLNPATTGFFNGDYRLICNYKDQWRSISKTYKTVFASLDFETFKKKRSNNFLGLGLSFYNDKAGKAKLGTNQINISIAYNLKLYKYNFFAAGLQAGYVQKSINYNNLKWDNQFNGNNYDPSLPTGEIDFVNNVNFIDFSAGLLWNYIPNNKNKLSIGVSVQNVNKPGQVFNKKDNDFLYPKIIVHGTGQIKINNKNSSFDPVLLYATQGKLAEINFGGLFKYGLGLDSKYTGANKSSSIAFGGLYRYRDAIIVLVNMEYKKILTFGVSYDINLSSLTIATKGRGGLELCIIYSGFYSKEQ